MRIVDALGTGASLADIASELYDDHNEPPAWPGDGHCIKSRVRRRVALARQMVRLGPSGILNHLI